MLASLAFNVCLGWTSEHEGGKPPSHPCDARQFHMLASLAFDVFQSWIYVNIRGASPPHILKYTSMLVTMNLIFIMLASHASNVCLGWTSEHEGGKPPSPPCDARQFSYVGCIRKNNIPTWRGETPSPPLDARQLFSVEPIIRWRLSFLLQQRSVLLSGSLKSEGYKHLPSRAEPRRTTMTFPSLCIFFRSCLLSLSHFWNLITLLLINGGSNQKNAWLKNVLELRVTPVYQFSAKSVR